MSLQHSSPEELAAVTADALAQAASHRAFELFKDRAFRTLAGLDTLDQTEQDRIFNELVVAHLVLIMLVMEAPDLRVPSEFREHLAGVKELVPRAYVGVLKNLGLESEHLQIWDKLITLRYEEYARDRHEVRAAAMQLESQERPMDLGDLSRIQLLLPVHAVAIGCHRHVCRGETDGRDDLFKVTIKALAKFYVDVRGRLEGRRVTRLTRLRWFIQRMLSRGR